MLVRCLHMWNVCFICCISAHTIWGVYTMSGICLTFASFCLYLYRISTICAFVWCERQSQSQIDTCMLQSRFVEQLASYKNTFGEAWETTWELWVNDGTQIGQRQQQMLDEHGHVLWKVFKTGGKITRERWAVVIGDVLGKWMESEGTIVEKLRAN